MLQMLNLFNIRLASEVKRLLIACYLLFYDPFKLVFIVAHYKFLPFSRVLVKSVCDLIQDINKIENFLQEVE